MPQRFLRPQITNSERWNAVSWQAQSLYVRLITLVDDFGRYDGRASVIWAHCFAVWNEKQPDNSVTMQQVSGLLQELAASRLIDLYELHGKKIVQLLQWRERVREGVAEKWPPNPNNSENIEDSETSGKVAATSRKIPPPSPSPSSSPAGGHSPRLKMTERISFEQELKRIEKELTHFGKLRDHDKGSTQYDRIMQLTNRRADLRTQLGVVA